ncbi:VOC family protein [Amphritea pacifica]|uniref:VOC family protein n=1 Tax=Amphritea pacifica TaxID=2811233 RepID=UPI001E5B47F1|nr:VOC family protein [Amphritea pacifica]
MQAERLDHLVLAVRDINTTIKCYTSVLGMKKVIFGDGPVPQTFGNQKIEATQRDRSSLPTSETLTITL